MSIKMRKLAAASIAIVCAASMCGCADSGTIGTINGIQIPDGMYIYQVAVAGYNSAKTLITEDKGDSAGTAEITVFDNTVEGKSAVQWLKDNAVEKLKRYAAVETLFSEYGLQLSDEDKSAVNDNIKALDNDLGYYAQYYGLADGESTFGEHYSNMGISKDTLRALTENSYKENYVFLHNYDADGLTPVTDDEINAYLTENYASVKLLKFTFTDHQGLSLKDDAEKQKVSDLAQSFADRFNSGEDWTELQYEFDLRQAWFDAWTDAEDKYAEEKSSTAEAGATAEAEAQSAATAEAQPEEAPATAEAAGTAESEAPAAEPETAANAPEKPIINTGDAEYDAYIQAAIDEATATKKESADDCDQFIKKDSSTLPEKVTEYVWNAAADGKATLFTDEEGNSVYVVVREDVTTKATWKETQHESFLHAIKDDAFEDLLKATYESYSVELDDYLVNTKYAPAKLRGIGK